MTKIKIKGTIVSNSDKKIYEWFGMDATSPADVEKSLNLANGLDVEVEINSGGGDLYEGSEIYSLLMGYKADVVVKIIGIAASAASIIAMAGKKIMMSPTAQLMIHNVWSYAEGDYREFEKESQVLKSHNESVVNAYMLKTGLAKEELLQLMNNETYFNAREAKEKGLIDEIMFDKSKMIAASFKSNMIQPEIIQKMRTMLNKQQTDNSDKINVEKMKMKLNLLKLMEVR